MEHSLIELVRICGAQLVPLYATEVERQQVVWWLFEHAYKQSKAELLLSASMPVSLEKQKQIEALLYEHTVQEKPLQYILGSVVFGDCHLQIEPPILIPRSETEQWVYAFIEVLKSIGGGSLRILDMCCGSGCIGIAIAKSFPDYTIYAADISQQAVELTCKNAAIQSIGTMHVFCSDLYSNLPRITFDSIVTNPPYISLQEWAELPAMVRSWEDKNALAAEQEGLALIYSIVDQAPSWLHHNDLLKKHDIPQLSIEVSDGIAESVVDHMKKAGWYSIKIQKDYAGKKRVVTGRIL